MSDKPMTDPTPEASATDEALQSRRSFLVGLGRWSKVVIGAAIFGGLAATESDAEAGWINRRGGGYGGGWVNRHGGGGWVNRHGGGGGWVNRHGGGGWVNRHGGGGGGSWINRR